MQPIMAQRLVLKNARTYQIIVPIDAKVNITKKRCNGLIYY